MNDEKFDVFTRCLLVGLFVGITAVYVNLLFDLGFRHLTHFRLSAIINVSSIIMGCAILLTICGVLYYGFRVWFKQSANTLFTVAMLLITAFAIWKVTGIVRSPIHVETVEFRELLIGILCVNGILGAVLFPMFYSREKLVSQII